MPILNIQQRNDILNKKMPQDEFIRRRKERQRRIRKRRMLVSFFVTIILLIIVGIVLSLTVFFKVENITASGSKIYKAEEIIKASGLSSENNLFTVGSEALEQRLKSRLPYIESIEIERKLPDALKIKVKDAEEFAVYLYENSYFTISQTGWVLEQSTEKNELLPEIKGLDIGCKVGSAAEFKDADDRVLLEELLDKIAKEKLSLDYLDFTDRNAITFGIENRFEVNIGNKNDLEEKIKHLGGMIKNMSEDNKGKINLSMWTSSNPKSYFTKYENTE